MFPTAFSYFRITACFIAWSLVVPYGANAQANPLAVSPRIGTVITAEDRAYFGLFPEVGFYHAAWVEQMPDDTTKYRIRIRTLRETEQTIEIDAETLSRFTEYLMHYETLLNQFYQAGGPLQMETYYDVLLETGIISAFEYRPLQKVEVILSDEAGGETIEGVLLYCNSSYMLIATDFERDGFMNPMTIQVKDMESTGEPGFGTMPADNVILDIVLNAFGIGVVSGLGFALIMELLIKSTGQERLPSSPSFGTSFFYIGALGTAIGLLYGIVKYAFFPKPHTMYSFGYGIITLRGTHAEYVNLLPTLTSRMYYRNGLPPELRSIRER